MKEHPNLTVLRKFDPNNMASFKEAIGDSAVFHYFNPNLPELEGDYVGLAGFHKFFESVQKRSKGTFKVQPISAVPVGDELVVVQTKNTLVLDDNQIELDVVVVWRIVEGKIAEVWDIPSAYCAKITTLSE